MKQTVKNTDKEKQHHFKETFDEYIVNSSLAGFLHLGAKKSSERYVWLIIHLLSLACMFYLIFYTWNNFMKNPMVTTVESIGKQTLEVPMPGISVCNINKISKWKAERYAAKLSKKSGYSKEELMKNISLLGYLYEYNLPPNPDRIIYFQNFLEKYDSIESGYYNTTDRLYELQPTCEEILSNCTWKEKRRPCTEIFVTELTMDGYCCVFNYISQHSTTRFATIITENNYKPISFGPGDSLDFTIVTNSSDTYFTTVATTADSKILISLPTDFPDTTSGSLTEKIIDKGIETVLKVSSINTKTTDEVRKYAINKRRCKFRDEATTIFGSYSFSDCIMDCKIKSIMALCQCIPYNFINVLNRQSNQYYQCTLADLSCLNSFSNKWKTLYPVDYDGLELDREKQNSLHCSDCVPACTDTMYQVVSDDTDIFVNGVKANFSVVHIRYGNIGIINKQDVFFYWYDMISLFGGLCSITMGLSFISLFELLYYFVWLFLKKKFKKMKKLNKDNNNIDIPN